MHLGAELMEIELFADPIIKEERIMTLQGPYALRLILRKLSGKNIYSGQRALQIRISTGGGAGTGVAVSSTPAFNKAKIEALIPILENANQTALNCLEANKLSKGSPERSCNPLVEILWLFSLFSEQTLFKSELPVEQGANKFVIEIIYNKLRKEVRCVIRSIMWLESAMPVTMNVSQFEIFKDRIIQLAQEL
jgi:hypothetical protein